MSAKTQRGGAGLLHGPQERFNISGFWRAQERYKVQRRKPCCCYSPTDLILQRVLARLQRQHVQRHTGASTTASRFGGGLFAALTAVMRSTRRIVQIDACLHHGFSIVMSRNRMRRGWQIQTKRKHNCKCSSNPSQLKYGCQTCHSDISYGQSGRRQDTIDTWTVQICMSRILPSIFSSVLIIRANLPALEYRVTPEVYENQRLNKLPQVDVTDHFKF